MHYVVALGNSGEEYKNTRHNMGFLVLDYVVEKLGLSEPVSYMAYKGRITEGAVLGNKTTFLYPETFMNNSGLAVKKLVPPDEIENLIVIHDDIDLPLGDIKISKNRGDGGHNGVKSIINHLGTKDFTRIRIGIAPINTETGLPARPEGSELPDFVLNKFSKRELEELDEIKVRVKNILEIIVREGIDKIS